MRGIVLLVVVALAGCEILTGPSSITEAKLVGTWTLTSAQPAGQSSVLAPADATYQLTLGEGLASTRADCTPCTGQYTLAGTTLTAGPLFACTRAGCPTAAFEATYVGILGGDHTVDVTTTRLTLTSPRGTLRYSR